MSPSGDESKSPPSPLPPRAKASRVLRACDSCRIRKAKCDGQLPCAPCASQRIDCSYNSPRVVRRRDMRYIQDLERAVEHLSTLLGVPGGVDHPEKLIQFAAAARRLPDGILALSRDAAEKRSLPKQESLLDTMIEATGRLNVDESGNCDYHGNYAGVALIRNIQERCNAFLYGDRPSSQTGKPQPFQPGRPPNLAGAGLYVLPSKDVASRLVAVAFDQAFPLLRFMHRPSFVRQFHRCYDARLGGGGVREARFQALLCALLALGELLSPAPMAAGGLDGGYSKRAEQHFAAARELLDVTDCRDLTSLQALVCMVVYLQSSGRISTSYSYIALATASCARMGLHRSATSVHFNAIDGELRRRIFWVLRTLDTYVTIILGLPRTLSDGDVDQDYPAEVDDESIGELRIKQDRPGGMTGMTAVNAHTKLIRILAKAKEYVLAGSKADAGSAQTYRVDHARIVEVEADLDNWFAQLPKDTHLNDPSLEFVKAQLLLRLAYAHAQMVLYRPFLHHIAKRRSDPDFDLRAFACASACINAGMQAVWLSENLEARGQLASSSWLMAYITFLAVLSLMMFVLSNGNDPTASDALSAAQRGYRILRTASASSPIARRCVECLDPLFPHFPAASPATLPPQQQTVPSQVLISPAMAGERFSSGFAMPPVVSPAILLPSGSGEPLVAVNTPEIHQEDFRAMAFTAVDPFRDGAEPFASHGAAEEASLETPATEDVLPTGH